MSLDVPGPDLRPTDYRVVLPPQWWRIDLTEPNLFRDVDRMVRHHFAGLDHFPQARENMTLEMIGRAQAAARVGGIEMHLSAMRHGDMVISGSLLISYLPGPMSPYGRSVLELDVNRLAEVLSFHDGGGRVRSCEVAELGSGRGVRRVVHLAIEESSFARPEPESASAPGNEVPSVNLDWFMPVPAGHGALMLLSFSTPLVTLEEPMLGMFDAIAATFDWVWSE